MPKAGLVKVGLPATTLDASQPGLADLRVQTETGRELAYWVEQTKARPAAAFRAKSFRVELRTAETVLTIETGRSEPLEAVSLQTLAGNFIKPARVEGSTDGQNWKVLAEAQAVFRQPNGALRLGISFEPQVVSHIRVSIDDSRTGPTPFSGAELVVAGGVALPLEAAPARIAERQEVGGQSRFAIDLGAANLFLAGLRLETPEPLFTRNWTLAVPEMVNEALVEKIVARGTIHRLDIGGRGQTSSNLTLLAECLFPAREAVLMIDNQDSAPLQITAVWADRRPAHLVFQMPEAGKARVWTGNAGARAPNYDLAALREELRKEPVSDLALSPLADNPEYRGSDPLAIAEELGAALDLGKWRYRKAVTVEQAGAQQVELDLETLARSAEGFGDLRLVRDGRQIPYILQRTSLSRPVTPQAQTLRPPTGTNRGRTGANLSRWSLEFPQPNLPLNRIECVSPTPLFRREIQLYEEARDARGETYRRPLGGAVWTRSKTEGTDEKPSALFSLLPSARPASANLVVETDDGDNSPITLGNFVGYCQVTRILFKATPGSPVFLYFGNGEAGAPRYDLGLIATQALRAEKHAPPLGPVESLKGSPWTGGENGTTLKATFWAVLALVVIGLLALMARLLPKENGAGS